MALRTHLTSLVMGMAEAAILIGAGIAWNASSHGGLFRALGGPTSDQPSASPSASPSAAAPLAWHTFNGQNGYKPACSYRFHLLIPAEKAAKISIDLSRYAGDASFIYPAIVNSHFLQAAIMEPGEPIAIDINDAKVADCGPGDAILDNLPRMCFGTKIEERCP